MPQAVEIGSGASSAAFLRSRHISALVFWVCACTLIAHAAEDGEEIPAEAPLSTVASSENSNSTKKSLAHLDAASDLANDPILGLFTKIKPAPADDSRAAIVDIGADDEIVPRVRGAWSLAREEEGPVLRRDPRAPQPGDPEYQPPAPLDEDEKSWEVTRADSKTAARAVRKAIDPEAQTRWNLPEPETERERSAEKAGAKIASAEKIVDQPRFPSGKGLDSNAVEIVSDLAATEKPEAASAQAPTTETSNHKTELIAKLKALAENTPDIPAAQKTGDKKNKNKKEPVDAQKHYEELIAQLEKNIDGYDEKLKAATDKTVQSADGEAMHVRDARAAKAMEVLLNNTPLGTIQGMIGDSTLKHLTVARVRVTDVTDTAVDAQLPDGFWCAGQFTTQAVSGLVKIEVNGGRFRAPFVKTVQVKPHLATAFEAALIKPAALNFTSRGWYLADLDLPLRAQPGERAVWMGGRPEMKDLLLAAQAEGVQILGVPLPADDMALARDIEKAVSNDVLILPALQGPRHAFYGCGMGLGVGTAALNDIPREISQPEVPLREAFEEIRARGGLAIYKNFGGTRTADVKRDILPLFPRLQQSNYYGTATSTRLYAANEIMFDTVAGPAYDAIAFDGTPAAETLWFNLLNQGYSVTAIGAGAGSFEAGRIPYGQTFIKIDGAPTRESVLESIRSGQTSVSFGPAAFCKVLERDKGPGSTLPADGRRLTLQIEAYASMLPGTQIDTVEIIRNGKVVHVYKAAEGEAQVSNMNWPVSETASAWYVVRATERRNTGTTSVLAGSAWTGAIYFRGAAYAPPQPAMSRITGTLKRGLTPISGTVTAVVPGQQPRQVATDAAGHFSIHLAASGALIFEAPGCEPIARRVFEHPKVQQALGAAAAERDGRLLDQFSKPSLIPSWKLLVSELEWNIDLPVSQPYAEPKIPKE